MTRLPDLESMDRAALLALWSATLGGEPPARLSRPFLRRILAFELQAREAGGLPAAVKRKLESLGSDKVRTRTKAAPKLKPGGRLLREWNGVTHVVDIVEGGFLWRGQRHRSLSAIARAITGAHWSGPRFFGLQEVASLAGAKRTKASAAVEKTLAGKQPGAKGRTATSKAVVSGSSRRVA
jgi:hypothetical protein